MSVCANEREMELKAMDQDRKKLSKYLSSWQIPNNPREKRFGPDILTTGNGKEMYVKLDNGSPLDQQLYACNSRLNQFPVIFSKDHWGDWTATVNADELLTLLHIKLLVNDNKLDTPDGKLKELLKKKRTE